MRSCLNLDTALNYVINYSINYSINYVIKQVFIGYPLVDYESY